MNVMFDYGAVRIISLGDPFKHAYDIQVQIRDGDDWKFFSGFNTLSDDHAYTNSRESAQRALKSMNC